MSSNDDNFELIWNIIVNTYHLKDFKDVIKPEKITQLKQYLKDEDTENFKKLITEIMLEKKEDQLIQKY